MLQSQKKIMGSFKFAALYQGVPVASEGQIVKNDWIQLIEEDECPPLDVIWFGIDCAFSEREMADESAICVLGINTRNPSTVYVRDIVKGKWDFPSLIEAVRHQYSFYRARVLCIEKAASGQSLIQVLKKEAKIPIEEMKPLRSKTTRLQAVCPLLENGRVKIVKGLWTPSFVKELTAFPYVRHDDSVDAMVWGLTYFSLKIDTVDRGIQDSIIQNRKWGGDLKRPLIEDSLSYGNMLEHNPRMNGGRRILGNSSLNDPDYNPQMSSSNLHLRRGGNRGIKNSGYDLW
jgi:predicted phage terminase large subunit-like protein